MSKIMNVDEEEDKLEFESESEEELEEVIKGGSLNS